jgi:hypothetical protein
MGPDRHPDSPEDGSRPGPGQDPGRAGENQAGTSALFGAGQRFDAEKAGLPLAAALAAVQAGLESLDDDALAGFLGGCQKIAAWSAGMLLDGIAEFAGRRPDDGTPGRAMLHAAAVKKAQAALAAGEPADSPGCDEFTADELMPVLRLSKGSAQRQVGLALALRYRLRATLAALLDGRIDMIRPRIIAEATDDLSAADAAAVEASVLPRAGKQTYVALGLAIGKAVVQVDPAGATKRRKRGEKQARVERWREYDGTGALAGRNLPPDDTAAADQALTARAVELRAAGLDGPLVYLRAVALIDQITGRDSRPPPGETGADAGGDADADADWDNRDDWPAMDAWLLDQHGRTGDGNTGDGDGPDDRDAPDDRGGPGNEDGSGDEDGEGPGADRDDADGTGEDGGGGGTRPPPRPGGPPPGGRRKRRGNRIQARINLTIPVRTLLALGDAAGDAGPFGPLDPAAARDMARAAAAHPGTRWCLTVTDSLGRAVAHGCARGPRPWVGQAPQDGPRPRDGPAERPGPRTLVTQFLAWLGITLEPIATISCDHHDAEPGYTPSRKLRHKIHARTPTCSYWGCRRPAAQCDDDHTCPWQAGGLTCQCNLAPLCRRHHRMKQRDGWHLEQPEPGVMVWRTPGRRTYITTPADCGS